MIKLGSHPHRLFTPTPSTLQGATPDRHSVASRTRRPLVPARLALIVAAGMGAFLLGALNPAGGAALTTDAKIAPPRSTLHGGGGKQGKPSIPEQTYCT